jgi:hypothetical protein
MELIGRYRDLHGPHAPPLSGIAESCYEGATLLAHLIAKAGRLTDITAADRLSYESPRGTIHFDPQSTVQPVHLAAATAFDFDVLATLPG